MEDYNLQLLLEGEPGGGGGGSNLPVIHNHLPSAFGSEKDPMMSCTSQAEPANAGK